MLVKFFNKRGTGASSSALDYLLAEAPLRYLAGAKDARGVVRNPAPVIVKGHPKLTAHVINQCKNKFKYTSGVLSFERLISPAQELEIIRRFEQVAFAGLKQHQVAPLWIRHSHLGRSELHFLVPRTELLSLRALNINPARPRQEGIYDCFRKLINHEFKLRDPSKLQLSPAEHDRLTKKLGALVAARTKYNQSRYPEQEPCGASLAARVAKNRARLVDRSAPAPGSELSPTRSANRPVLERLGRAAGALDQTCRHLDVAGDQLGRAVGSFSGSELERFDRAGRALGQAGGQFERAGNELARAAQGFPEALAQRRRTNLSNRLLSSYGIPERYRSAVSRDLDRDGMELDLADTR